LFNNDNVCHVDVSATACAVLICSRLQQMEQTCEIDLETMRQECSRRVSDLEKRLHMTIMEKDALKLSLHDAEVEVSRR